LTGADVVDVDPAHVLWSNTTCPDGTNNNNNSGT
jgi:hypothetical protein